MIWPFQKKYLQSGVEAVSVEIIDDLAVIDVRGQTCPGYLLSINKAVEKLENGMSAKLLITYPPCGNDVKAWCKEKNHEYIGMKEMAEMWEITIHKY